MIFGSIIGAGIIGMLIAPFVSRMLRFFPPVVTGTIILVIGVTLMRVGIQWIFGVPVGPTSPQIMDPANVAFLDAVKALPAGLCRRCRAASNWPRRSTTQPMPI